MSLYLLIYYHKMLLLLVPAAVVRRQTWVNTLSPQTFLEVHNLQIRILRIHKIFLILVRVAKGVEGCYIVGAVVRGGGRHLAVDAKFLMYFCNEFSQELVCLPFLKTIIILLIYFIN